ncbi:hypothetical protein ACLOJK_010904 [Asimina triloba]
MASFLFVSGAISGVLLLSWIWRLLYSFWWRPKSLERFLRDQGIRGLPYRFPFGDLPQYFASTKEAWTRPMNLSHQIAPRVIPFLYRTVKDYGNMTVTWEGKTPRITFTDPELIREILLNKNGQFEKQKIHPMAKLFVSGLAFYSGEKWAKHRRIVTPAFHQEKLKPTDQPQMVRNAWAAWDFSKMLPAFLASCNELIGKWEKLVSSNGSYELDVCPEFQNLTGDVISRTAFGSNYKEGMRIIKLQTEQAELLVRTYLGQHIPGYRNEIAKEVHSILRSIIEKREKAMKMGEANNDDLLGLLMESNLRCSQDEGGLKNGGMTIEEVIEECKLFYFAGQETTSVLLTWTMVALSMDPMWQFRAREEVLQAFGKDKPNYDGLSHLKIVTMILYEVLRLYPALAFLVRFTYEKIKLGNITIPPGVQLCLPCLLIHHDQELWGKDADEFNPERFAEGVSNATTKNQFGFFPFGWGPRVCLGQNFGLLEAKLALSMVLQHFSFELSPAYTHAPYTVPAPVPIIPSLSARSLAAVLIRRRQKPVIQKRLQPPAPASVHPSASRTSQRPNLQSFDPVSKPILQVADPSPDLATDLQTHLTHQRAPAVCPSALGVETYPRRSGIIPSTCSSSSGDPSSSSSTSPLDRDAPLDRHPPGSSAPDLHLLDPDPSPAYRPSVGSRPSMLPAARRPPTAVRPRRRPVESVFGEEGGALYYGAPGHKYFSVPSALFGTPAGHEISVHPQKERPDPLASLLATGLPNHDGEKWAKHRRIINPAFRLEKLKVTSKSHSL